jgi:hypothetical protein
MQLLQAAARAYPEPVSLDVEAWALGITSSELQRVADALCKTGHLQRVEPTLGPHASACARLTQRGLALAQGSQPADRPASTVERRAARGDRRRVRGSETTLPAGMFVERRHHGQDRRAAS